MPLTNYILKNLKRGQVFVDVGANMGLFTILAGYLVGKEGYVVAFEANVKHYEIIRENLAMNYLTEQTLVFNAAVYSEETKLTFHATEKFMGNGSLIEHDENYKNRYHVDTYSSYEVDAVALDPLFTDVEYIDLVKIDIEGGEYHAFLGLEESLRTRKVGTVIFELNKQMLRNKWFTFMNRLMECRDDYGYKFFILDQKGETIPTDIDNLFMQDEVHAVVMSIK